MSMPPLPELPETINAGMLNELLRQVATDAKARSVDVDGWTVTAWVHGPHPKQAYAVEMFSPAPPR